MTANIDPITTEVIRNAFNAIAEDISAVLGRSAFSPIIYECHDYGVALFDEKGQTLGQAPGHPFFIGGLDWGIKSVIEKYGRENLKPGDVYIVNDSYITGGHLNDVDIINVLTYEGELVGFASSRAHWYDIGTAEQGFPVNTRDIFQEGLRIGPTKIMDQGVFVQDIVDIICLNSRAKKILMGDLNAQIAAGRMGERRYIELIERFGLDTVRACSQEIFRNTERKYRDFISTIPDGVYVEEGFSDNDFLTTDPVPVKVTVTVKGSEMTIDTTGSSPQCEGNINCGFANSISAARLALVFLYPDASPEVNHGAFMPLTVKTEEGSVFAAVEPAACMHPHPGMLMLDLVIKALAPHLPENVAAGLPGDSWNVIIMGNDPDTNEFYVSAEALDGGWGANYRDDGESAIIHSAAGYFLNMPVETFESKYPVLVRQMRLGKNSGGAGKYRGGLNVEKEYEMLTDGKITLHFDRAVTPQWGLFGASDGAKPNVTIYDAETGKTAEYLKVEQLSAKKGSRIFAETGGGGGYGNPKERDPERVRQDFLNGYIDREQAEGVYGVYLDETGSSVDAVRTAELRKAE